MKFRLSTILMILLLSISIFTASPGSLDSSFGVGGRIQTPYSQLKSVNDVKFQPDGKIIVVGAVRNSVEDNFVVARFTANGERDTTFSADGFVETDFDGNDFPLEAALQQDGKIVVAGNSYSKLAIARYNPSGSLDNSFGTNGKLEISVNVSQIIAFGAKLLEIDANGKLVVGFRKDSMLTMIRLNQNGTFDSSFGNSGTVTTTLPLLTNDLGTSVNDVKIRPNGKILICGEISASDGTSFIVSYNENGSLDTTFNGDGIFIGNFSGSAFTEGFSSMALLPNNKLYVVGSSNGLSLITRINENGTLDTSFGGGDGSFTFDVITNETENATFIRTQSDNKIIIQTKGISDSQATLIRLNSNGTIDTTFGKNGTVRTSAESFFTTNKTRGFEITDNKLIVGFTPSDGLLALEAYSLNKKPIDSADFDGDGVTDTAVYRPSVGQWFILRSSDNSFAAFQFGLNGDVPIDGDFDGDGKSDLAIFRPSNGVWFFWRSSDGTNLGVTFGNSTDRPIPGDYDKDGKTDIAVFRPGTGEWLILRSSTNFSTFFGYPFGQNGDIPISSERK